MALAKRRVPNFLVDCRSKENKDAPHQAVFPSQERRADASSPKLVDFFYSCSDLYRINCSNFLNLVSLYNLLKFQFLFLFFYFLVLKFFPKYKYIVISSKKFK